MLKEETIVFFFFFFQAEDGIRDLYVTGVQTCALPIWGRAQPDQGHPRDPLRSLVEPGGGGPGHRPRVPDRPGPAGPGAPADRRGHPRRGRGLDHRTVRRRARRPGAARRQLMPPRRTFGNTWWGAAWVDALEQRAKLDPNRLPRGRTYARR